MTAKVSQPMPEGVDRSNRPKPPAAPPKKPMTTIVDICVHFSPEPMYTVYRYGFIMNFKNQNKYLDWSDSL